MSNATILITWTVFGLLNLSVFLYYWDRLNEGLKRALPFMIIFGPLATAAVLLMYWWDE